MSLTLENANDEHVWEKFLETYCPQALFQSWLWGEVQKKSGQRVLRYLISEGRDVVGVAQIFVVRARRGAFLHVRHGPVWKHNGVAHWREFLELLAPIARRELAWFVRVSPLLANTKENMELLRKLKLVRAPIHEVDAERCWVLDLEKSDEELLMGMRKTTRYEIRVAQKAGVEVRKTTDPDALKHFFRLYEETSKRHGFVGHISIAEEFEIFSKAGKSVLLLGYDGKKLVAGAIVLFLSNEAIYHHGASIASRVPVSHLVQWEAIQEAKNRGMKVYNFYGIAPEDKPNHPWRGITLFKTGFGGREVNYVHAHDLPLTLWYGIPYVVESLRTLRRGY